MIETKTRTEDEHFIIVKESINVILFSATD